MPRLDPQSLPQHLDRLYRAAWALCGSPHEAEDLVQETCARVLARPRLLRGQDELGYLMQALRNTFLSQRRTAARRPQPAPGALHEYELADARGGARPEQAAQTNAVFAAIAGLSESYRLALVAVDIVGLSYREAAETLDTREATIATRVFRARAQVARELGDPANRPDDDRPERPMDDDRLERPTGTPPSTDAAAVEAASSTPRALVPGGPQLRAPDARGTLLPGSRGKVTPAGGVFSGEAPNE
jgi:RNA polymerase sigma-70 factor, ECF subfamily